MPLLLSPQAIPAMVANAALTETGRRPIRVFLIVFMTKIAMGFTSTVRRHRQTLFENLARRVYEFRESLCCFGAIHQRVSLETVLLCENRGFVFDSFNHDFSRRSPIQRLLFSRGPAAISRFIVAIVVNALKSESFWAVSHIVKKSGEVIAPAVADFNSASAVIAESMIGRSVASAYHSCPYPINGSPTVSVHNLVFSHNNSIA